MTPLDPSLREAILSTVGPDCWNGRWSQVNGFGGQMAIELEVGEFLASLVRATKPQVVVETGTHKGFSTLMIASALKRNGSGHLYTIDIADYGVSRECERFGLGSIVTFIQSDSSGAIRDLLPKVAKIDFLWLDADHGTEFVIAELESALPALVSGSFVAFHDTLTDPREAEAVRRIKERFPSWESMALVTARGFHLMRVSGSVPLSPKVLTNQARVVVLPKSLKVVDVLSHLKKASPPFDVLNIGCDGSRTFIHLLMTEQRDPAEWLKDL